ncbi:MAG: MoaD/ThiS family protein [Anaerolineales bacterium]
MEVNLQLYSIIREKLPPEAKGRAVVEMDNDATLADLLKELDITRRVVISVNDAHEAEMSRQLQDGDQVKIFSSISGGSMPYPSNDQR